MSSQQLTLQETLIDVEFIAVSMTVGAPGAVRNTTYIIHTGVSAMLHYT